ncbi:MAG: alpha/beta hydrolase [Nitrospirales bacterium]|nr:alpha/beta hydrolase [Nitrospirales bacterium]
MSIRYFATNRNHEDLARALGRTERLGLERKGYFGVNMQAYMSHYLATTNPGEMPERVLVKGNAKQEILGPNFLGHPKVGKIVICVHGFNVNFHDAQTWYSILTNTLRKTKTLSGKIVTDPVVQDKDLLENQATPDKSLTAFVGFSWPSDGSVLSYPSDQREAIASGSALANLITTIRQETNKSVNLICHSMGNFLACHMLKSLIRSEYEPKGIDESRIKRNKEKKDLDPNKRFFVDRYIMLAPDVERRHVTKCVEDAKKNRRR